MTDKEAEAFVKQMDEALALAQQEMLKDKASRNESVIYCDDKDHIKRVLASDILAGKVHR